MACQLYARPCRSSVFRSLISGAGATAARRFINTAIEVDSSANPFIATPALAAHDVQTSTPTPSQNITALSSPTPRHDTSTSLFPGPLVASPRYSRSRLPQSQSPPSEPLNLTSDLRAGLARLALQPPFYATIHLHGKPYLVTAGDTLRLPFLMHGVRPGDVLRLTRATTLGSREFTMRGGQPGAGRTEEPSTIAAQPLIGLTDDPQLPEKHAPRSRPHAGPPAYLDERLFTCRATVLGTEAEPMRVKIKTKQRQRRVKKVESKHRYTILKISELGVNSEVLGEAS